jgi:hypothetical protein
MANETLIFIAILQGNKVEFFLIEFRWRTEAFNQRKRQIRAFISKLRSAPDAIQSGKL